MSHYTAGVRYNAVLDVQFSLENTTEPVTVQEAKDWLRIDISDDDTLVGSLITAARIICEQYTNISFITRTVTATLHNTLGGISLPYGPVNSITSVTERDTAITDYTMSGASFQRLVTVFEQEVTVVYTAGYATLPKNLKTAILNQIGFLYENRGDDKLSDNAKVILNQVRRV